MSRSPTMNEENDLPESHLVHVATEVHYDVYQLELGEGTPVYDAWAIEDDKTGANPDVKYDNLGAGAAASAAGRGFRTPAGRPSSNELWRFRVRGCQDCWAALFFFALVSISMLWGAAEFYQFALTPEMVETIKAHMGIVGADQGDVMVAANPAEPDVPALPIGEKSRGSKKSKDSKNSKDASSGTDEEPEIHILNVLLSRWTLRRALWITVWSAVCVVVACLGFSLFRLIPRHLIVLECWIEFGLFAFFGLLSCLAGNLFGGILLAVLAVLPLLWLYLVRSRIPFAVCMLTIATRIVHRHKGLFIIAVGTAFAFVLYCACTLCFLMPPLLRAAAEQPLVTDGVYVLLLLFTLLWVQQVLANVAHVTVAGVVATWYFAGEDRLPNSPIRASFQRATTLSLGSICFGSLFVSAVSFLRFLVQAARGTDEDGGGFLGCVCDCFLGLVEQLLQYFNGYAFVHVAVYGCSFLDAARRTWSLAQQCFFAAVFNDCLVYQAVTVLAVMLAAGTALAGGLLCGSLGFGLFLFFLSLFVNSIVFGVVSSTVTTIFVCFAEVPEGMELSFPELYTELRVLDALMPPASVHHQQTQRATYGTL